MEEDEDAIMTAEKEENASLGALLEYKGRLDYCSSRGRPFVPNDAAIDVDGAPSPPNLMPRHCLRKGHVMRQNISSELRIFGRCGF